VREPARRRRPRTARIIAPVAAVVAVAAAAIVLAMHAAPDLPSALQRLEALNRNRAADWVSQEVSRDAVIACDPQMCAALEAHGFPAGNVRSLAQNASYPLSSSVVIVTAAVRALFGTSLATEYAPEILTTIGSGTAQISIRVIAPHGAATYLDALAADLATRRQDGGALLASSQITTSALAKSQMATGLVDSRLLFAIAALAGEHPIDIVSFGNISAGGSSNLPLRYADLAEDVPAAHMSSAAYVGSMLSILRELPAPYRIAWTLTTSLSSGLLVLRIDVPAPSPLGLLGPTVSAASP
jgi:hypothetical protein